MVILRSRHEVLGMSTGRIPPGGNETWCWHEEVKDAIRVRKQAKKKWETPGRQEERESSIGKQTRQQRKK